MLRCLPIPVVILTAMLAPGLARSADPDLTSPARPGRFVVTIKSGNFDRTAQIQIPACYQSDKPLPLVLVLHGAGGNGRVMLDHYGWSAKAEKEGFLVVAPDGLPSLPRIAPNFRTNPPLWNSGQLISRSPRAAIDDVAYVRELFDDLKQRVPYQSDRVYCCGHSNGGGMAFRLAAELSDRFVAVGSVAGMMSVENPKPRRPLPTLVLLGTKDPLMPIEGGEVSLPWGKRRNPPIAEPLAGWAKALGCESEAKTVSNENGIKRQVYPSTSAGPTLTVLLIDGHGHQWPGATSLLPESSIGPNLARLNATDTLWEFFRASVTSNENPSVKFKK